MTGTRVSQTYSNIRKYRKRKEANTDKIAETTQVLEKNCNNCLRPQRPLELYCLNCNRIFRNGLDHWNNPDIKPTSEYLKDYATGLRRLEQRINDKRYKESKENKENDKL